MTTHSLRRWGAVLTIGGLCSGLAYSFFPASPASPLLQPAAALNLVGMLLMIPGVVAFQLGQEGRARATGWAGTGLLVLGLVMLELPHSVLALVALDRLQDLDAYHASFFGLIEFPGILCVALGQVLVAVAIWRAGTYPRWAAGLIAANFAVTIASTTAPALATAIRVPAPNYVLVGGLGLAMLRLAATRSDKTSAATNPATPAVA
jgi:hypothetical protein